MGLPATTGIVCFRIYSNPIKMGRKVQQDVLMCWKLSIFPVNVKLAEGGQKCSESLATHGPAHVFGHYPWVQRAKKNVASSAAHKSVIFASPHAKFSSWDITARRNGVSAEGHYTCVSSPHLPPPSYRHHATQSVSQSGVDASLPPSVSYSTRDCCCWQRISVAAIPGVLLLLVSVDSRGFLSGDTALRETCCVECVYLCSSCSQATNERPTRRAT